MKTESTANAAKTYGDIQIWADKFQAKMQEAVTIEHFLSFKQPMTYAPKINKKDVNVWKLPDEVGKAEFRRRADSVDVQLEAVCGFKFPDVVVDKVRRSEMVINETWLKTSIETMNK